ncbi:hypothetical protein B1K54_05505 [Streptomyces sp. fd1-xmd]|nr:hypothetical protein B1K54_05505 [Streptomyces sp. fd1-xmd]
MAVLARLSRAGGPVSGPGKSYGLDHRVVEQCCDQVLGAAGPPAPPAHGPWPVHRIRQRARASDTSG